MAASRAHPMDGRIQYLNTDLDLSSSREFSTLVRALTGRKKIFLLHPLTESNEYWWGTFEAEGSGNFDDEPEHTIAVMLKVIESLRGPSLKEWKNCKLREFNIGYDCGSKPWAFNQGLSSELLGRVAAIGASIRITIYPESREPISKSVKVRTKSKPKRRNGGKIKTAVRKDSKS